LKPKWNSEVVLKVFGSLARQIYISWNFISCMFPVRVNHKRDSCGKVENTGEEAVFCHTYPVPYLLACLVA
jgi:hypothetical protein